MAVQVWTVGEFLAKAREQVGPEPETNGRAWLESVEALGVRAHTRGDGIAVYTNEDLGHPDVGQWQVMSYGSDDAQLETRHVKNFPDTAARLNLFVHGDDQIPVRLPDIGGQINWRYQLEAIVPSYEQQAKATEFGTPGYSATPPTDRLVVVQVKVTGGASEEVAKAIVKGALESGLDNWLTSAGEVGFSDDDSTGTEAYDRGVRVEPVDTAVI